ncbi:MAG: zinc dependent phospholipase C family protein [Nitrospiraceae bacterium]|nr:zinc dependent phospholipase C family protein [Nitrospiraceae bacterium]
MIKLLTIFLFIIVPSNALAWGPLTHIYLGSEVYYLGSLLPACVYALIRKYRNDFLYGNLMADMIVGKKYLPNEKSSHSWEVALNLFDSAKTHQQKAFAYGYLTHLAADTVAHKKLTNGRKNVSHTFLELKADSLVDKSYWFQAIAIDRKVQLRNDLFLEKSLERFVFSFKTNKRIFKSVVLLSGLHQKKFSSFMDRKFSINPKFKKEQIKKFHDESLYMMVDLLQNGRKSTVLKENPLGSHTYKKVHKLS